MSIIIIIITMSWGTSYSVFVYLSERCSVDLNISKEQVSNSENDFGGNISILWKR